MHAFQPSQLDNSKCAVCKRIMRDHTAIAQCECCPKIGPCELYVDMLMCKSCYEKEIEAQKNINDPIKQEERINSHNETVKLNQLIEKSHQIDQGITLVQDIFNAKTIAIVELMKAIDEDESVQNKPYARLETATKRVDHLTKVIFEQKNALIEAENELRAFQLYINEKAKELRTEEREKLKIKDINYQPVSPKTPKPKSTGTKKAAQKVKVDMTEMIIWADRVTKATGIATTGNVIHMIMLQKNMNAEAAARDWARNFGKEI